MIYHGSCISGLHTIKANSKSHSTGNFVAYFSEDRCYALVCCRSRDENFVTMGVGADGKQHYIERFPNQLEALYKGRQGYIYLLDSTDGLTHGKGHSWESKHDVPVRAEGTCKLYQRSSYGRRGRDGKILLHPFFSFMGLTAIITNLIFVNFIYCISFFKGKSRRFPFHAFSSLLGAQVRAENAGVFLPS